MEPFSPTPRLAPGSRVRRIAAVAAAALLAAASLASGSAAASTLSRGGRTQHRQVHGASDLRGCANADTQSAGTRTKTMRDSVVCLINQQRSIHGLAALHASRLLDRSSQSWTDAMVATRSFTHGSDFSARITAVGFSWQAAGENIATGYPTPQAVVSAWMASAEHCQNILNPTYTSVGTGIDRHPVPPFGSGGATWTQDFALPISALAAPGPWAPSHGCPY
jgi:uncharacterized protein YkwD